MSERAKRENELSELDNLLDAERYRRLAVLVEAGEWFAGHSETIDSYGSTDDTYMDDKDMLDAWLDRVDVVESADSWRKAMNKTGT